MIDLFITDSYKVKLTYKDFSIILGVFYTEYFYKVGLSTKSRSYPFNARFLPNFDSPEERTMLAVVHKAAHYCTRINFLLDNIKLPLSDNSRTCEELMLLHRYPELLNKTEFWLKGKIVEKSVILAIIQKVKDDEIYFENINISSIKKDLVD